MKRLDASLSYLSSDHIPLTAQWLGFFGSPRVWCGMFEAVTPMFAQPLIDTAAKVGIAIHSP